MKPPYKTFRKVYLHAIRYFPAEPVAHFTTVHILLFISRQYFVIHNFTSLYSQGTQFFAAKKCNHRRWWQNTARANISIVRAAAPRLIYIDSLTSCLSVFDIPGCLRHSRQTPGLYGKLWTRDGGIQIKADTSRELQLAHNWRIYLMVHYWMVGLGNILTVKWCFWWERRIPL